MPHIKLILPRWYRLRVQCTTYGALRLFEWPWLWGFATDGGGGNSLCGGWMARRFAGAGWRLSSRLRSIPVLTSFIKSWFLGIRHAGWFNIITSRITHHIFIHNRFKWCLSSCTTSVNIKCPPHCRSTIFFDHSPKAIKSAGTLFSYNLSSSLNFLLCLLCSQLLFGYS